MKRIFMTGKTKKNTEPIVDAIRKITRNGAVPLKIRCIYADAAKQFNVSFFHESMSCGSELPDMVHYRTNELVYVIRGAVVVFLDSRRVPLKKGSCLFIPAGTAHRLKTGKQGMEAVSIFSPPIDPANPDATLVRRGKTS